MRHYEIVVLIHPDRSEQAKSMIDKYCKLITDSEGKLHRLEDWGRKNLAYPINKLNKSHYFLLNVECGREVLQELQSLLRYNDAVVRYMIIKRDEAETKSSFMLEQSATDAIDYLNLGVIKKYIGETYKILPSRITGLTSKMQRQVATAIKRARYLALIQFTTNHKI